MLQYLEDKPIQRIHFVLKNFYGTRDNLSIGPSNNVFNLYLNKRTNEPKNVRLIIPFTVEFNYDFVRLHIDIFIDKRVTSVSDRY